ncbi:MAG: MFS transporter [Alphaproteobacteria bacterium]
MTIAPEHLSPTDRRRNLVALIVAMTAGSLIYGMSAPLLSLVLDTQGVSEELIGFSATAQALIGVPLAPLFGRLLRAWGPARPILLGLALTVLTYLLMPIQPDVWVWLPLRFVLSIAGGMMWITGEAWVNQVAEERMRGRILAFYSMALAAGGAVGPVALTVVGTAGWPPFLAMAAITAASAVPVLAVRRRVPAMGGKPASGVLGYVRLAPVPILICGVYAVMDGIVMNFLPLYGLRLGLDDAAGLTLLTVMSLGGIAGQLPAGWLADHVDRNTLVVAAVVVLIGGTAAMPFVMSDPVAGAVTFFVFGAVRGGLYTVAMVLLGARFQGADLASASAAFGVFWGLGMVIGPMLGGVALERAPETGLPVAIGALLVAFLPVALAPLVRRRAR